MTLTDFLLARIAEDEAVAAAALADTHYPHFGDNAAEATLGLAESEGADAAGLAHFSRHDPARVMAECEAKRRIVEWSRFQVDTLRVPNSVGPGVYDRVPVYCTLEDREGPLQLLALPYADHPDYREEWKP